MPLGEQPQRSRLGAHPEAVNPANPPRQPRRDGHQIDHFIPRRGAQRIDRGGHPRRVAGPVVQRGLLLGGGCGGFDREEAYGVATRAEPRGAEVGSEGPDGEARGGSGRVERRSGLREDGVAEAGEETRVVRVERDMRRRRRRGGGARTRGVWGRGEEGDEGEVFGEGGGPESAGERDALGAERAAERGGGGGGGGGGRREGGDAGAAEGVAAREDPRRGGGGVEGGEAHRALGRLRVRRWRCGARRHGRLLCSAGELAGVGDSLVLTIRPAEHGKEQLAKWAEEGRLTCDVWANMVARGENTKRSKKKNKFTSCPSTLRRVSLRSLISN